MFDIAYRIGRSSIRSRLPFVYFAMLPVITMLFPPSHMQRGQASLTLRRLAALLCMEEGGCRAVADFISFKMSRAVGWNRHPPGLDSSLPRVTCGVFAVSPSTRSVASSAGALANFQTRFERSSGRARKRGTCNHPKISGETPFGGGC